MSKVFLDANVIIYLLEAHPEYGPHVRALLQRLLQRGDDLCTSALAVGEILAGTCMTGDELLRQRYREKFRDDGWTVLPFTERTVDAFVQARRLPAVKAPDAVHLACAAAHGVDVFVTHDRALTRLQMPGIGFIVGLTTDVFGSVDDVP